MGYAGLVTMVCEMDLNAVIEQFRGPLIGALSAWGAAPRDAVELAQDAFAEAYLNRDRFKGDWGDQGAVGPWLYGIARNLHSAAQRKATGSGRLVSLESANEVAEREREGALEAEEQRDAMSQALAQLEESWRTVLTMRYSEGASLAVIGALLDLSERAVEGRLRRARAALEEELLKTGIMETRS